MCVSGDMILSVWFGMYYIIEGVELMYICNCACC